MDRFEYWHERSRRAAARAYNGLEKKTAAYLVAYRDAYDDLAKEAASLYAKLTRNGKLSLSELYKYDRYMKYMKQVGGICDRLARGEIAFADKSFSGLYQDVFKETVKIGGIELDRIPAKTMDKILQHPWSGENYSQRIWANRDHLVRNTRQTVIRGVVKGQSITSMTDELQNRVEASAFNARRLIRTESMHYINQGKLDGYRKFGIEKVTILVAEDERTCDECMANDGRFIKIDEAELVLPVHPLCRCTYTPMSNR
jgi:SPP1 gp7 family putative phage head morphogenesis protein